MIVSIGRKILNHYPTNEEISSLKNKWLSTGKGGMYLKHSTFYQKINKIKDDEYIIIFTLEMPKLKFYLLFIFYMPLIFFIVGKEEGIINTYYYIKNIIIKIKQMNE